MEVQTSQPCRPLVEVLQSIEDPRRARGQRYSMTSLLSLCCAGMLCGCQSYSAIAQWGRDCSAELANALGFLVVTSSGRERRPGASTLYYALRVLNRTELERRLGAWAEELLCSVTLPAGELESLSIDGKTLRGSAHSKAPHIDTREEVPGVHLLSALSHRLGLTLGQCEVSCKNNEITALPRLLQELVLEGRIVTLDALLTQRSIAKTIAAKKGSM